MQHISNTQHQRRPNSTDAEKYNTEHSSAASIVLHEIWESFLAPNNKDYKNSSAEKVYDIVHKKAKEVEGDVMGVKIGTDGGIINKFDNGVAYENFVTDEGTQMHKIVKYKNGKVISVEEKAGAIDIKKILEDLRKKYAEN